MEVRYLHFLTEIHNFPGIVYSGAFERNVDLVDGHYSDATVGLTFLCMSFRHAMKVRYFHFLTEMHNFPGIVYSGAFEINVDLVDGHHSDATVG